MKFALVLQRLTYCLCLTFVPLLVLMGAAASPVSAESMSTAANTTVERMGTLAHPSEGKTPCGHSSSCCHPSLRAFQRQHIITIPYHAGHSKPATSNHPCYLFRCINRAIGGPAQR